jgi:antirestriction protein ArdC
MSRDAARARPGASRTSLYDEITTKIIAELEAGRVPWVQPWGTAAAKAPLAMPKNASTGRFYSGINVLILWGSVIEHGFPVQGWLTFRQALGLGGNVRKGEHGTTVVYADRFIPDDEKKRAQETGEEAQAIPFLKRFTVFNLAQCEGLPEDLVVASPPPEPGLIEPQVEALIKATGIDFRIGGSRPSTCPRTTMCKSHRRRLTSSRSTGTARRCMSSVTPAAPRIVSIAISRARSAPRSMRLKSWSPR